MARRALKGYLEEDEQERAVINTHDAKDSMEAVYEDLRERLGAKHPLTLKAAQAVKRSTQSFPRRLSEPCVPGACRTSPNLISA